MKKFLISFTKFICITVFTYPILLLIWGLVVPYWFQSNLSFKIGGYGHMNTRIKELKKINHGLDILFLGSSHCYRGFDTRIFDKKGLKTFNLGSSAQTPMQTHLLLERYLDNLKPKKIIYEVFPNTFMSDGVESSTDILSNDVIDELSFNMAIEINHIKTYQTLFYAWVAQNLNIYSKFTEDKRKRDDHYIKGGFVEKELSYLSPPNDKTVRKIKLNDNQFDYFVKTVQKIQDKGYELILVFAPVSRYLRYSNIDYYDSLMSNYAKYYNFNNLVSLNDTLHFYDTHHLNQVGVEIFNKKLIEELEKR